jgi:hypothetical protein
MTGYIVGGAIVVAILFVRAWLNYSTIEDPEKDL